MYDSTTGLHYDEDGILVTLSQFSDKVVVRKAHLLAEKSALEAHMRVLRGQLESNPRDVSSKLEYGRAHRNLAGVNKLLSKWLYAI